MNKSSFGAIFLEKFTQTEQIRKNLVFSCQIIEFLTNLLEFLGENCLSFFGIRLEYRRLTDVWVGLTEPLGQKSISFNNLLWENGKRYYHGTGAI